MGAQALAKLNQAGLAVAEDTTQRIVAQKYAEMAGTMASTSAMMEIMSMAMGAILLAILRMATPASEDHQLALISATAPIPELVKCH